MKKQISFLSFLIIFFIAHSQHIENLGNLFFINNFSPEDYADARQNWDIIQDQRGIIYVANSSGNLLEYDGNNWNKISVSKTALRSLAIDSKNRIYVGGKNELGYLEPNENGELVFKSLKSKLPEEFSDFDNVWKIFVLNDSLIYFQTYYNLFVYKNDSFKVFSVDEIFPNRNALFFNSFYVNDNLYVFVKKVGILKWERDTFVLVKNSEIFSKVEDKNVYDIVKGIISIKNHTYVISSYQGIWEFKDGEFIKLETPIDKVLYNNVYVVYVIDDKYIAFALIPSGGLLITDENFNVVQFISNKNGLRNDKIMNIYFDKAKNLWLCLDNGLANVALYSSFFRFDKDYGFSEEAKVNDFIIFDSILYVATSSGILYRKWFINEEKLDIKNFSSSAYLKNPEKFTASKKFSFVDDKVGFITNYKFDTVDNKVWFVSVYGFGYIENFEAHYVISQKSFRFLVVPEKDFIIAVSGSIFIIRKDPKTGVWKPYKQFETVEINGKEEKFKDLRTIVKDEQGYLWFASDGFGVYRIKFSENYDSIISVNCYSKKYGLRGLPSEVHNKVFAFDGKVYFTTEKGIYTYNSDLDSFYPVRFINNLIENNFANLFYVDKIGNFWVKYNRKYKLQDNWLLAKIFKTDTAYDIDRLIFVPLRNRIFSFYEVKPNDYLIGTDEGFVRYLKSQNKTEDKFYTFIRKVSLINYDSLIYGGYEINPDKILKLDYGYRNIRFVFAANYYKAKGTKFSYILEGYDDTWHNWTEENIKEYSNIPPGTYTLKVKAKNVFGQEAQNIAEFKFEILPPWYRTIWAYIIYALLIVGFIWLIVYFYTLRLKRQKQHLEELVKERTKEIEKQKDILKKQNEEIKRKNKDITSSIEYAKRIQTAILPLEENIKKYLPEYFIFFKPRDIVSGDFYWFAHKDGKSIIAAVDCTGHGVPGAFMSILGTETLNTIVLNKGITDPAEILNLQHKYIKHALKQKQTETKDGMDMALCVIHHDKNLVEFAGAKNPLVYIKNNQLKEIKGDRQGIADETDFPFKKHSVEIDVPTVFYIFSDGYKDQFGGQEYRKFLKKYFYDLLLKIHNLPFDQQKQILYDTIVEWMKDVKQTDDMLVIGFKVNPK